MLEYLSLTGMVEGQLNEVMSSMRHVVLALLVAEEAAGGLTPYRRAVLEQMRGPNTPAGTA